VYKRQVEGWVSSESPLANKLLTFENFVDELSINHFRVINAHHFIPQVQENFEIRLRSHKKLLVYDITSIDYGTLEELFQTKIPPSILLFRGGHQRKHQPDQDLTPVHNLAQEEYSHRSPAYSCFYTAAIMEQVRHFYREDFEFFKSVGFVYSEPEPAISNA
jgi:hypothetical protein